MTAKKPRAKKRAFEAISILKTGYSTEDSPIAVSSFRVWFQVWRSNPDVRSAVTVLSDTCAKSGVEVVKQRGDKKTVYKSPETDALVLSFLQQKGTFVRDLKVGGNAFVSILRNFEGNPVGVSLLDPRNVTIYTDSVTGEPTRYEYRDPMRQFKTFSYNAEDVIHSIKETDPDNPAYGCSPVETIVYDALGDNRAALANFVFFDNNAMPAALLGLKDGVPPEMMNKLAEEFNRKYGGAKNQGKVGMMSNAFDKILQLTDSNKDAKWLELRSVATEKICAAMGVPKTILNYNDGMNYSSSDVQYKTFIEQTVRPLERVMEGILNKLLSVYEAKAIIIDEHISQAKEWADIAIKLKSADVITQDEAREYVGFQPIKA